MVLRNLQDLLVEQTRDLYDAELQYQNLLPSMLATASDADLRQELQSIGWDVEENLLALQRACTLLEVEAEGVACEAMRGLVREARGTLDETGDPYLIDAALMANAQRIAHYEIAGFGTARQFARVIGHEELTTIFEDLVGLAGGHDRELTRVAQGGWFTEGVNRHAETTRTVEASHRI